MLKHHFFGIRDGCSLSGLFNTQVPLHDGKTVHEQQLTMLVQ